MMRRALAIGGASLALLMFLGCVWLIHGENGRGREQAELILDLQAQRVSRHVNAWKPQYEAYLHRFLNSERSQMKVLLYDLSGWEIGRPRGTRPPIPLNETAARFATHRILRPLHGEAPLPPYHEPPQKLVLERRLGNRLFATNVVGASWVSVMKTQRGESWLVATTPVADFDEKAQSTFLSAWLQAAIPLEEVKRPARERWAGLLFGSTGLAILFCGLTWWSSRHRHALQSAAILAEQIPIERLAVTRLPESIESPEAARLMRACNRLLEQVAAAHVAQQRFVADAAHELRTPLTILRGEIQVALREPNNHPFLIETLRSSLDEAVHLSRLVDSLLTLARADAGQPIVAREPVLPGPLVRSALAKLEPLALEHRVKMVFETEEMAENASVQGDPVALERIVRNLVENALKHSPSEQTVRVTLTRSSDKIQLAVIDRGIGIGPEHLQKLFDRFYRIDAARRRTEGGAGLGLAIVKTLVEAQGGTVAVESEIGVGSRFVVELPCFGTPAVPA